MYVQWQRLKSTLNAVELPFVFIISNKNTNSDIVCQCVLHLLCKQCGYGFNFYGAYRRRAVYYNFITEMILLLFLVLVLLFKRYDYCPYRYRRYHSSLSQGGLQQQV